MARMVASMARMVASMARIDASMLRIESSMALLGRTCGASGRPRSRIGRTVGVPQAALGRAGPHQVANIAQLFPLEIAVWRSFIPKSAARKQNTQFREPKNSKDALKICCEIFKIFVRFSSAPKIRQGAPGKFKGTLICMFFGARHFGAHSWASEFSRKKS